MLEKNIAGVAAHSHSASARQQAENRGGYKVGFGDDDRMAGVRRIDKTPDTGK